jgi:hypothetical protein
MMVSASLPGVVLASVLVFAGIGGAATPSRYPLDLSTAVANAYGGTLTGITRSCTVWLHGGRDEYALAAVTLRGGRNDTSGFQFLNTAGWFNMWRYHAPTASVPAAQRTIVAQLVGQVATICGGRWRP